MHLAFEEVDEAAAETGLGIAAGVDRNEIAHGAEEIKRENIELLSKPDTTTDLVQEAYDRLTAGPAKMERPLLVDLGTQCPILSRMREVAIANLRKRDRPALEMIDLKGTKDETRELARAQIFLEALHPEAKVEPHPGGALSALMVAAVPFIGQPDAAPKTSAQRQKFFIAAIQKAMAL